MGGSHELLQPAMVERRFCRSDEALTSPLLCTTHDISEQKRYKYPHKGLREAQHCLRHVPVTMYGFSHSQMPYAHS